MEAADLVWYTSHLGFRIVQTIASHKKLNLGSRDMRYHWITTPNDTQVSRSNLSIGLIIFASVPTMEMIACGAT